MSNQGILNNSGFWITIAGIVSGIMILVVKQRIRRLNMCWGCLDIQRDTHAEEREAELQMNRNYTNINVPLATPSTSDSNIDLCIS